MSRVVDELVTRYTLDSKGYAAGAKQVSAHTHQLSQQMSGLQGAVGSGGGGFAGAMRFATAELDSATPILQEVVSIFKSLAIVAGAAAAAIAGFSFLAMKQAADFEAITLGLAAYSDGVEGLERNLKRLREVSKLPGLGFEEAIQASVRLQAAGLDARLAERALLGFGNALAAVGGGKAELDGVLMALTQIASKSQVSAAEINQIAERVPQIRTLMLEAFGTANTEQLAKMGITPQQFILKIIDALEKLPRVAGKSKNAFENFSDAVKVGMIEIGSALNTALIPQLEKVSAFFDHLSDSGILRGITEGLVKAVSDGSVERAFDNIVRTFGKGFLHGEIEGLTEFIAAGEGLGDTLVRAGAILVAAFERLPTILEVMFMVAADFSDQITGFLNGLIERINGLIDIINNGIPVRLFGREVGRIGGEGTPIAPLSMIQGGGFGGMSDETRDAIYVASSDLAKRAAEIYGGIGQGGTSGVMDDPSKGGFRRAMDDIAQNTLATAINTGIIANDFRRNVLGGGDLGRLGLTPTELGGVKGGGSIPAQIQQAARRFGDELSHIVVSGQHGAITNARRMRTT